MTRQQKQIGSSELGIKDAQVENDLLMTQIHQLEEELDHYFRRNQELEKQHQEGSPRNATGRITWVDKELLDIIAENKRLNALVKVLRKTHQLETNNALNIKLGNILIQGADSFGTLLAVPGKIGKIWRESRRKKIPNVLGVKGFDKVVEVYDDGGFEGVEKLLAEVSVMPTMQANAYTVLARQLMRNDRVATAEAARRAYELDPKPFRLKWLAFRLQEAGQVIEAEAMLDVLPTNIKFSESEERQASRLRKEGKQVRQQDAKKITGFAERQHQQEELSKLASQIEQLMRDKMQEAEENDLLLTLVHQDQEKIEKQYRKYRAIEQDQIQLREEVKALEDKINEYAELAMKRQSQVEQLTQEKTALEAELQSEIETLNRLRVHCNLKG